MAQIALQLQDGQNLPARIVNAYCVRGDYLPECGLSKEQFALRQILNVIMNGVQAYECEEAARMAAEAKRTEVANLFSPENTGLSLEGISEEDTLPDELKSVPTPPQEKPEEESEPDTISDPVQEE